MTRQCTKDVVKSGGLGAATAYLFYKAVDWKKPFWKMWAGGTAVATTYLTYRNVQKARKSC